MIGLVEVSWVRSSGTEVCVVLVIKFSTASERENSTVNVQDIREERRSDGLWTEDLVEILYL